MYVYVFDSNNFMTFYIRHLIFHYFVHMSEIDKSEYYDEKIPIYHGI